MDAHENMLSKIITITPFGEKYSLGLLQLKNFTLHLDSRDDSITIIYFNGNVQKITPIKEKLLQLIKLGMEV